MMIVMDCEKRSSLGPESFGTDCLVGVARSGLKKFARMVRYKTTDTLVRACSVGNGGHRENATVTKGRCSCATTPCCTLTMTNQEDGKGASAPTSNSKTNQTKRNPFSSVLQEPDRAAPNKGDENDRFHRRSSSSSSNGMKSDTEDEEYAYGKIDTVASKPTTTTATSKNKSKKAPQQKHPSRHVVIGEDTDNDDAEEDAPASPTTSHRRAKPPRPSMAATALLSRSSHHHRSAQRRRRRSSGRFLQLGPSRKEARLQGGNTNNKDDDDDTDDDDDENNVHTAGTRDRGDPFTPSQNRTNTNKQQHQPANLSELYQTAIRMNAENKINANNSWNLRLVENIDTFLEEEDDEGAAGAARTTQRLGTDAATRHPSHTTGTAATNANAKRNKRVNFTKASCTLDASVKIYSYRVDDVHLSSYKVLANLNRSNNNSFHHAANNNSGHGDDDNEQDLNDENQGSNNNSKRTRKHASTLETNLANINLNKLDAAFDIDPLFHKMSKTFDEGGAKGLLLVNLGVGEHGCNIVFDSSHHNDDKEEEDHPTTTTLRETDDEGPSPEPPEQALRLAEGMVDISNWTAKLESLLNTEYNGDSDDDDSQAAGSSNAIRTLPLVPQLDALRAEHDALEAGGFIDDSAVALAATVGPKTPGKRRYQADDQEEQKADYSIHQEAKERSVLHQQQPMSGARRVLLDSPDDDGTPHQPTSHSGDCEENGSVVDFGNGYDDGNDDDDDDAFDMYIATTASRFSDAGLDDLGPTPNNNCSTTSLLREGESSSAAQLIDAIASGATVLSGSDYEYFSVAPFINNTTVSLGFDSHTNQWAGAAHWKRSVVQSKVDQLAARNLKKKSSKPKNIPAKKKKRAPNLDIALHDAVDLSHLFVTDPMKNKKNTKSQQAQPKKSSSSFTLSQTMITKLTNQENLLPIDAGLQSLEQLTKPFLLPNFVLHQNRGEPVTEFANATTIEQRGHDKTVSFHVPDWEGDDGSCGDDNDGPGFDFGGNDDEDDEDDFQVMDLEGVRKVAKVRVGYATVAKKVDVKRLKRDLWNKLETTITSKVAADPDQGHEGSLSQPTKAKDVAISFRETVQELEQQQAQTDITISFYFICILHLANEKGLLLEQQPSKNCDGNLSLDNFSIHFPSTSAVFPMSMPP